MKKICFVFLSVVGISFCGQSKVLTVSNNTNSPGQYTDLQAACDAASDYDTIYIHASEKAYDAVSVKKPLVLIGEGAIPNQQVLWSTSVARITFTYVTGSDITSSGSKVYGLNALFSIGTNKDNVGLGGFLFERCKGEIASSSFSFNLSINQFVGNINLVGGLKNTSISNSIINVLGWSFGYTYNTFSSNNIIRNCILSSNARIYGAVVANNIFYDPSSLSYVTAENTTFTNNLFYFSEDPFKGKSLNVIGSFVTYTGNLVDKDPKFVTPALTASVQSSAIYSTPPFANYNLSVGSPALTLGTDGTQAGIYGGPTPWVEGGEGVFRYHTMPSQVPYVTDMDILNTAIPLNGTLNVKVKARTQL